MIDVSHRGFNEALNGFTDEGWSMMGNDGMDDVTILVNSSPDKLMGLNLSFPNGFPSVSNAVLCAKASMLLQVRLLHMFQTLWIRELFQEVYNIISKLLIKYVVLMFLWLL